MSEFDRAANNILQNLDESFIINENFIDNLKQKFGEFTSDTIAPFVKKALQKLKQEDPQMYSQIGTAVQNNDIESLQRITQGSGDIQQEGFLKGLGTMAKGGWEAAKGIDKLLAKKLSGGKRGLLYIILIAITLMAVTGEKPVEYEGFKDIDIEQVEDFDRDVESLDKSTKNLGAIGKYIDASSGAISKAQNKLNQL